MTSATLATSAKIGQALSASAKNNPSEEHFRTGRSGGLEYFASRVGGLTARLLQLGSPFDYQRQAKLFVVGKMPDPRESGYADALVQWIEHFVKLTHGKAFVLFTNFKLMRKSASACSLFLTSKALSVLCRAKARHAR